MKFWSNIKYHTLMNLRWCGIQIFGWPCCVPGGQGQLTTAECGGLLFFAISLRQEAFGSLPSVWDRRSSALCHQFETGGPRLFAISLRQGVPGSLPLVWDRRSSALCHQFEIGGPRLFAISLRQVLVNAANQSKQLYVLITAWVQCPSCLNSPFYLLMLRI